MRKRDQRKINHQMQAGFTVEASVLVPFICFLLALLVQMILYLHDTSVLVSTAYEAAQKATQNECSSSMREAYVVNYAEERLKGRCLAVREYQVTAKAAKTKVQVSINGTVGYWNGAEIRVEKEVLCINSVDHLRNIKKAKRLWEKLD